MRAFEYVRPASVAAAGKAFAAADEARFLAGGQTLIPVLKQRLATPSHVIDISRLPELRGISVTADAVTIRAMTRHAEVASSDGIRQAIPALARLAGGIGDPHVRNRGTIGGSVANNDPAADYPAAVLGLGAIVETDRRAIAADDYFQGLFATALEEGELIVGITFPRPARAGYAKFPHPASRYAMVGVMAAVTRDGVRVAVTGAGAGVFRVPEMERALARSFSPDAVAGIRVTADDLTSDIHGTAEYRAHLVTVMARRAVALAAA